MANDFWILQNRFSTNGVASGIQLVCLIKRDVENKYTLLIAE